MNVKKKTTVELLNESETASLYSISFEMDGTTEFEKFVAEFEMNATFNRDYQRFEKILDENIEKGYVSIEEKELTGIEDITFEI